MNNLLSFVAVLQTVGYALGAILILLLMITVHELGHYIVGKIFKFKINEFAIGMGPAIFKRKLKSGEWFSVRIFPLGGYCAFEGEDEDGEDPDSFTKKKPWQRILVLLAGATMNYILALIIIILSFGCYGQNVLGAGKIIEDASYANYSLQDGDSIIAISNPDGSNKTNIYMATDLITALNHKEKNDIVIVEVRRGGEVKEVAVKLRSAVECKNITMVNDTYKALGVGSTMMLEVGESKWFKEGDYIKKMVDRRLIDGETYKDFEEFLYTYEDFIVIAKDKKAGDVLTFWVGRKGYDASVPVAVELDEEWESVNKADQAAVLSYFGIKGYSEGFYTTSTSERLGFFTTIGHAFEYSFKIGGTVLRSLGQIITGAIGLNAVGGTVTTIVTTTQVISYGFKYALEIAALIGVNLAVFNLLPIPALDGSRIVFCIIEWIFKKPVNRKVEGIIHAVGFVFILAFAVLVDILQFI